VKHWTLVDISRITND